MPREDFVQPRGGTAALWASRNPVLAFRELGVETDTKKMKIGDNVTHWNDLPYITGPVDGDNVSLQVKRDTDANLSALTTPFLSGQFVYGQTTGKTVIGDGESLFDELPDLRKQFQNVVVVQKTGKGEFSCANSKYSTDTACIQAALTSLSNDSKLVITSGNYTISSTLLKTNTNLCIEGIGNVTFSIQTPDQSPGLRLSGSIVTSQSLHADSLKISTQITLEDASSVHQGDLVEIYNNLLWAPADYPTLTTGEIYLVKSVSGNVVTLTEPLLRDYTTANESKVHVYRPIEVQIKNINFKNNNSTGDNRCVVIDYSKNSIVSNCIFSDSGLAALSLYYAYNTKIIYNEISNCLKAGSGYGVALWSGTAFTFILNNYIENCRHTITSNSAALETQNRGIYVSKNVLIGGTIAGSSVIDAHALTIDYTIKDNYIFPKPTFACYNDESQYTKFEGNKIYGGAGGGSEAGGCIRSWGTLNDGANVVRIYKNNYFENVDYLYYSSGGTSGNTLIIENNIQNGGKRGLALTANYTETFKNIIIRNNEFNNVSTNGIYIRMLQDATNVTIENNKITWTGVNGGIDIDGQTYTNGIISLSNNQITDVGTSIYGIGIAIKNISNAKINGNTIKGIPTLTNPGIYEYSGCDYNHIENNDIALSSNTAIHKTGTHTIIRNNPGYTTENTGTATIPTSSTSVTIAHGLVAAPTRYSVTPSANVGNCWIGTITSTQMTINCSTAPEADTVVSWSAQVV